MLLDPPRTRQRPRLRPLCSRQFPPAPPCNITSRLGDLQLYICVTCNPAASRFVDARCWAIAAAVKPHLHPPDHPQTEAIAANMPSPPVLAGDRADHIMKPRIRRTTTKDYLSSGPQSAAALCSTNFAKLEATSEPIVTPIRPFVRA